MSYFIYAYVTDIFLIKRNDRPAVNNNRTLRGVSATAEFNCYRRCGGCWFSNCSCVAACFKIAFAPVFAWQVFFSQSGTELITVYWLYCSARPTGF